MKIPESAPAGTDTTQTTGSAGAGQANTSKPADAGAGPAGTVAPAVKAPDAKAEVKAESKNGTLIGKEAPPDEKNAGEAKGDAKPKLDLKAPEGVTLDKGMMEKFIPLAEKFGMSQEAAQEFLNLGAEMTKSIEQRGADAWTKTVSDWEAAVKADPDVGGAKLKESVGFAAKGARTLGGAELIKVLDDTGLANNPVVFKALVKAGRSMSEDKAQGGAASSTGEPSAEEKDAARYPKMAETLAKRGQK